MGLPEDETLDLKWHQYIYHVLSIGFSFWEAAGVKEYTVCRINVNIVYSFFFSFSPVSSAADAHQG